MIYAGLQVKPIIENPTFVFGKINYSTFILVKYKFIFKSNHLCQGNINIDAKLHESDKTTFQKSLIMSCQWILFLVNFVQSHLDL